MINPVSQFARSAGWFQEAAIRRVPTRESDESFVQRRAVKSRNPITQRLTSTNWIRAVVELKIEQRVAEVAQSSNAGSSRENWLRAERELQVALRTEEISKSADAGTDYENWLGAEYEIEVARRAERISHSRLSGSHEENRFRAERELISKRTARSWRAEEMARSMETTIEIRIGAASP